MAGAVSSGHGRPPWIAVWSLFAVTTIPVTAAGAEPLPDVTTSVASLGPPAAASDQYIVRYTTWRAFTQAIAVAAVDPAPPNATDHAWPRLNAFVATLSAADVVRLRSDPTVASVEENSFVRAATDQVNPPWGLDRIDQQTLPVDRTYTYDSTGAGVTAYVVDSGIRTTHTEFAGRIVRAAAADDGDDDGVEDCYGHGTHVAGTLGGTTYGVAKDVFLVPVKVLSCGGTAHISTVIDGIEWIVGDHQPGVPAVANLSLEGTASPALDAAVEDLIADGVTAVVAAGNAGFASCDYSPARVPAAITVGASEHDDEIAGYSNFGVCNDLFAPGTNISSAWVGSDTARATLTGTSMAAPHVSGAVARLLEREPWLSPAEVWARLDAESTTAELTGTFGGDPNKLLYIAGKPLPSAPQWLTGMRANHQVTLSWSYPAEDRGLPITDYVVMYKSGKETWQTYADGVSSATTATVTGLTNGRCYEFRVAAVNVLGTGHLTTPVWLTPTARGFTALEPQRVFDTRRDQPDGAIAVEKVRYGGARVFRAGLAGTAGVPSEGVAAVLLNLTVVDPQAAGFATVYPCDAQPPTSNVNYAAGQTTANALIAALSPFGEICVYSSADTDLVADVEGWFPDDSGFNVLTPTRLFDTRPDQPQGAVFVDQHRYGELRVHVSSIAGIPPSGVGAVSLNVIAVDPVAAGFVTVYPCNERPLASNLNYAPHQIASNAVVAPVSPDGDICLTASAAAWLVADVNGWFAAGSTFAAIAPIRIVDTRATQPQAAIVISKQQLGELRVTFAGVGGVPVVGVGGVPVVGASAVLLNITAVDPTGSGFVTVHPCGTRPLASHLNFAAGQVVPNIVIAPLSAAGEVCFYASVATDLVVDLNGWYASS